MNLVNTFINQRLTEREQNLSLRILTTDKNLIDFCSNDYLGFAQSPELQTRIKNELNHTLARFGSGGSRLISGNNLFVENLETEIATFHDYEAALIFNSGYDANLGLFSSVPQKGDTIITDELIHASILDGARLSFANRFSFRHNDLNALEKKLQHASGRKFIAIESIYSMDGDEAPLIEIVELAEKYDAALIVDEAHALGLFGENGRGLVHRYNLQHRVFAQLVTFGKALGCHGAAVLGSAALRSYLINFARSFIYTTAASPVNHISVKTAYAYLQESNYQSGIKNKIDYFRQEAGTLYANFIDSRSAIQCLLIPGNERAKKLAYKLKENQIYARAILHPTVALGKERLRICLHSFNTEKEITMLINTLKANL